MIALRSRSVQDTRAIAAVVADAAEAGDLIVLAGQMGAGKTAFAQGFAGALGIIEPVTSPTYTLVHTYRSAVAAAVPAPGVGTVVVASRPALHHADLYRLAHTAEIDDLALDELLDGAIVLVEWGDVVDLGGHLRIELHGGGADPDERSIDLGSTDPRWDARWERLQSALGPWTP